MNEAFLCKWLCWFTSPSTGVFIARNISFHFFVFLFFFCVISIFECWFLVSEFSEASSNVDADGSCRAEWGGASRAAASAGLFRGAAHRRRHPHCGWKVGREEGWEEKERRGIEIQKSTATEGGRVHINWEKAFHSTPNQSITHHSISVVSCGKPRTARMASVCPIPRSSCTPCLSIWARSRTSTSSSSSMPTKQVRVSK